jgi:hypothetical protein
LRRIKIDEGAEPGGGDAERAVIESHGAIMRQAVSESTRRGNLTRPDVRVSRISINSCKSVQC